MNKNQYICSDSVCTHGTYRGSDCTGNIGSNRFSPGRSGRLTTTEKPLRSSRSIFRIILLLFLFVSGCGPEIMDDYNDSRFELVDQNGETVLFPDDFEGEAVVMGFIYTNCPDVCPLITANLSNVYEELENPEDIRFVLVTFDPSRDTPEVLKNYAEAFGRNHPPFQFLTGSEEEVGAMMVRFGVRTSVSYTQEVEGKELYFLSHSDKILLINDRGQLLMDYGGSMTPARILLEDIKKLGLAN